MEKIIEMLDETNVVEFDEQLAQITLDNPENDWSNKITNGIGGEE